ncbi:uncharacterized protein with HXXEE motif [Brevibacterium pityocampae]
MMIERVVPSLTADKGSRARGSMIGPPALLLAWALHDIEEAIAFPSFCDELAERTGVAALRIDARQSWAAVGLMGILITAACCRGYRSRGRSRLYRAVLAGLEAHIGTHVGASVIQRGYSAGVATVLPIMLPGVLLARRELARAGTPLAGHDRVRGAMVLVPAALVVHVLARTVPPRHG